MNDENSKPGNYLALDGGLSALSELYVLEEMLSRLQFDLKSSEELAPWQYFKIIIGTGRGGLAAIFIGRLKMTASDAIEAYIKLLPVLSVSPTEDETGRRRNTDTFREAFQGLLIISGYDAEAPMVDEDAPKTVVVTSNIVTPLVPHLIRSYRVRGASGPPCTILQAACACVASQDQFAPVVLKERHRKLTLVDVMVGYANPTKELMREAQAVFGEKAEVSTILSLGAGKNTTACSPENDRGEIWEFLKRGGAAMEQVHEDIQSRLSKTLVYFRFNVEKETRENPEMAFALTSAYLRESAISEKLDQVTRSIHHRPLRIKFKDINSVTAVEVMLKPRPSLVQNFVGREDILEATRQAHFTGRSSELKTPVITVLSGLGGSGKTQIALRFALEFEDLYPDAPVYFLNASSDASLKADFQTLVRSVGAEHHAKSHEDALVWLATRLKNWLLIMDNADNPSLRIFPYIPKCAFGNIIITTRNSNQATLAPNNSHHIDGLSEPESVALILKASGYPSTQANQALTADIVRELGNLPLALAQAAGYIFVNKCLSSYLDIYRNSRIEILSSSPFQRPDDYPLSVAKTIQMSLGRLPEEAQDVMRVFSHLDFTCIPHGIIEKAAKRRFEAVVGTDKSDLMSETLKHAGALRGVFCDGGKWSEFHFNKAIAQCLQYSLLRLKVQGNQKFYSMHILVQSYLEGDSNLIQGYHPRQLVTRLLGSSITFNNNYQLLTFSRLLLPHLRHIQPEDVVEAGDNFGFGRVLDEAGDRKLALVHRERCVSAWKALLGCEHQKTLWATTNLAISYKMLGRNGAALELEEEVLEMRKKLSGPEDLDTLLAMHNLAISYGVAGQTDVAMKMEEQVLEKRNEILGLYDPDTLSTMGNLAASYSELGRAQDALKLMEQVLDLRLEVSGSEHPHTLRSMHNLALSYKQGGRLEEAIELEEQVAELSRRVLGEEHPDTLYATWWLADSTGKLGLNQRRMEVLRGAIPVYERVWGVDDWRVAHVRDALKGLLLELERKEGPGPSHSIS